MTVKTVLVTGSSKGLGRSIALLFAKKKYNVIIHGRDGEGLQEVERNILKAGANCDVVRGEITSEVTMNRLYGAAKKRDIDILINNAGIYLQKPFANMTSAEFRRVVEINLIAPVLLTKKIYPLLERKKSGLIVNINSMAGRQPSAGESAYAASKHGLRGFTKVLQYEANKDRIRVVDIYPGAMNTAVIEGRREVEMCIQVEDVADLIYRLCKDYRSMRISEINLSRRNY